MKRRKIITIIIIILAIGLLLFMARLVSQNQDRSSKAMILFYGESCPHCKIVEQYINDNNVKVKLDFKELEVFNNKANAALMSEKAKTCNLDTSQGMGVPFFFDGQNCLIGDQDIINFFKTK